jgi:hypothetical protein
VVGDVEAGQMLIPSIAETNQNFAVDLPDRQTGFKKSAAVCGLPSVGLRPSSVRPHTAQSHPD